jgi:hypothetical protein
MTTVWRSASDVPFVPEHVQQMQSWSLPEKIQIKIGEVLANVTLNAMK